jgi:hypothetical protein
VQSLPYPNSLKFLFTPITCKSQKFKRNLNYRPSSSLTQFVISQFMCVCVSLSLSHALFHWGTQSQSFYLLSFKSYTSFDVQAIDQRSSQSLHFAATLTSIIKRKRPLWEHVKPLAIFLTLGGSLFTKWNFPPKRLDGVLVFHWAFHGVILVSNVLTLVSTIASQEVILFYFNESSPLGEKQIWNFFEIFFFLLKI